jgi:hypothetical protein
MLRIALALALALAVAAGRLPLHANLGPATSYAVLDTAESPAGGAGATARGADATAGHVAAARAARALRAKGPTDPNQLGAVLYGAACPTGFTQLVITACIDASSFTPCPGQAASHVLRYCVPAPNHITTSSPSSPVGDRLDWSFGWTLADLPSPFTQGFNATLAR